MTKHAELIARLEAAEVGSRELDIKLALETECPYGFDTPEDEDNCPHYTTSLDAALSLAERVLPDARRVAIWRDPFMPVGLWEASIDRQPVQSKTPALALCIAILKALEAKQ